MNQIQFKKSAIILRNIIYYSLWWLDRYLLKKENNLVILCYHSLASDGWRFSVNLTELKKQIVSLKKSGYTFISLQQFTDFITKKTELPKKSVLLTFDDGYTSLLRIVPYFKKLHIYPALFLLSETRHPNRDELVTQEKLLTKKEIIYLMKHGWTIGSHSHTHSNLITLKKNILRNEIFDSKLLLEETYKTAVKTFAYPRGKYNRIVCSFVKRAGYDYAFTMDDGIITRKSNHYVIPRIGVDRSHAIKLFKTIYSPSVVLFRQFIKQTKIGAYL